MAGSHAVAALLGLLGLLTAGSGVDTDVVVYGGTPAGVAAAITAATGGAGHHPGQPGGNNGTVSVTLLVEGWHVGGMMSGGLGWDDVYPADRVTPAELAPVYGTQGLYARFTAAVAAHYAAISAEALALSNGGTRHEPHIAEAIFLKMLAEANVTDIRYGAELTAVATTQTQPQTNHTHTHTHTTLADSAVPWAISSISATLRGPPGAAPATTATTATTTTITASRFVDASYLGDLLAMAGAGWVMGREGRREFGELNAGVAFTNHAPGGGSIFLGGSTGAASPRIPAMTWRMCFTTNASNRVGLARPPPGYNRTLYLGYVDDVTAGRSTTIFSAWSGPRALPPAGTKFDMNCNPAHLGFIWAGPEKEALVTANASRRAAIIGRFRGMALGLLYFQQNDPAVAPAERAANRQYGLCADEFGDTGHFPHQLYIREARRLRVPDMFTERDMVPSRPGGRPPLRPDSVAVGTFPIDSFPCSEEKPVAMDGTSLEGYIGMQSAMVAANTIPVSAMLSPNVTNLVVPVAVGASHVAFSAVRLEPTWMLLGSAAGVLTHLSLRATRGRQRYVRQVSAFPSFILAALSWICVGIPRRRVLAPPVCA